MIAGLDLKPGSPEYKAGLTTRPLRSVRVLTDMPIVAQLLKKFLAFYETRKFITLFATDLLRSLAWVI
jgi:hypothetical protein